MQNQGQVTCKVTSDWTELPSHRYSTGEINVGGVTPPRTHALT